MNTDLILYLAIIFLSFTGVLLTIYIHHKKQRKEAMVCPLNGHCENVITSEFSTFLGMPVELLGMFYYGVVAVGYALLAVAPGETSTVLMSGLFLMTSGAFLFSTYLIFVQAFYLHQWCTWCLFSAGISHTIFIISFFLIGWRALLLLSDYSDVFMFIYAGALAVGLGSATLLFVFLFKFLRDLHVSQAEAGIIRTISQVTWIGLAVMIVTGTGLFIAPDSDIEAVFASGTQIFFALMTIGFSSFLYLKLVPMLIAISENKMHVHYKGELRWLRKISFLLSSGSLVSWYMMLAYFFFLSEWTFGSIFTLYIIVLVLCGGVSLLIEQYWPSGD